MAEVMPLKHGRRGEAPLNISALCSQRSAEAEGEPLESRPAPPCMLFPPLAQSQGKSHELVPLGTWGDIQPCAWKAAGTAQHCAPVSLRPVQEGSSAPFPGAVNPDPRMCQGRCWTLSMALVCEFSAHCVCSMTSEMCRLWILMCESQWRLGCPSGTALLTFSVSSVLRFSTKMQVIIMWCLAWSLP